MGGLDSTTQALALRLARSPNDPDALRALERYRSDPELCAAILSNAAHITSEGPVASHWLSEAAASFIEMDNDRQAAVLLKEAIERDPTNELASHRFEDLCLAKKKFRALVTVIERRASDLEQLGQAAPPMRALAARVWTRLGDLYATRNDTSLALEAFEKAIATGSPPVGACREARHIHRDRAEIARALEIAAIEAELLETDEERITLLREEATMRLDIGDKTGATRALRKALELDDGDLAVAEELGTVLLERIKSGLASEGERLEAAALFSMLGDAYGDEEGLAHYQSALDCDPACDRALTGMLGRQVAMLELSDRVRKYLQRRPDGPSAPLARIKLAPHLEAMGKRTEAIAMLEPCLAVTTGDEHAAVTSALERLYAETDQWEELAQLVLKRPPEAHADGALAPARERGRALFELARKAHERGQSAAAARIEEMVLEIEPAHEQALATALKRLRSAGAPDALAAALARAAEA
ncbi:MAG: hypothetical protein U0271_38840, partial [Polyangiaceae bacterium]